MSDLRTASGSIARAACQDQWTAERVAMVDRGILARFPRSDIVRAVNDLPGGILTLRQVEYMIQQRRLSVLERAQAARDAALLAQFSAKPIRASTPYRKPEPEAERVITHVKGRRSEADAGCFSMCTRLPLRAGKPRAPIPMGPDK